MTFINNTYDTISPIEHQAVDIPGPGGGKHLPAFSKNRASKRSFHAADPESGGPVIAQKQLTIEGLNQTSTRLFSKVSLKGTPTEIISRVLKLVTDESEDLGQAISAAAGFIEINELRTRDSDFDSNLAKGLVFRLENDVYQAVIDQLIDDPTTFSPTKINELKAAVDQFKTSTADREDAMSIRVRSNAISLGQILQN
jgi:hypothetical protein